MSAKKPDGALLLFSVSTSNRESLEKAGVRFTDKGEFSKIVEPSSWKWSTAICGELTQEEIQGEIYHVQTWEIRLLDHNGRERAGSVIWSFDGYVPSGYQFTSIRRFDHDILFDGPNDENAVFIITDGHSDIVYISEGISRNESYASELFRSGKIQKAFDWLDEHYPNWRDTSAYWND